MEYAPLELPNVHAYVDVEQQIGYVIYRGKLTQEATAQVYKWMMDLFKKYGVQIVRGGIFDFREVTEFERNNLSAVQRRSRELNTAADFSATPIALVVSTLIQEQMVRVGQQVTPQQDRKRIVRSVEEGLAFINSLHPLAPAAPPAVDAAPPTPDAAAPPTSDSV
jgi:hypothetical protein